MKFRTMGQCAFLTCTILMLLINSGLCATYYVDAKGGTDSNNGTSEATAWETVGKVNSVSFASGDSIKFKRGQTWTDATLTLNGTRSGTSGITVEDYGVGAKPRIDGNSVQPIYINHALVNLTLKDIDISGSDTTGNRCHIYIVNGLTIDGIDYNGHTGSTMYYRSNAINIGLVDGDIEIKNCTIQNLLKDTWTNTETAWGSNDAHAIILWYAAGAKISGTVNIHNNVIHDVYADCIQAAGVQTTTNIFNNQFYRFGENAVDHKKARYVTIYDNSISSGGVRGDIMPSCIGGGGGYSIWPDYKTQDITVRDNYIYDTPTIGIAIGATGLKNYKVYRNHFKDVGLAIRIGTAADVEVYNNFFELNADHANSLTYTNRSAIRVRSTALSGISIHDNGILISSNNHLYGIAIETSITQTSLEIKDNNIYMTRNVSTVFPFYVYDYDGNNAYPVVNNNSYYNPNHSNRIRWDGTIYDITEQIDYRENCEAGAFFGNDHLIQVDEYTGSDNTIAPLSPPSNLKLISAQSNDIYPCCGIL